MNEFNRAAWGVVVFVCILLCVFAARKVSNIKAHQKIHKSQLCQKITVNNFEQIRVMFNLDSSQKYRILKYKVCII